MASCGSSDAFSDLLVGCGQVFSDPRCPGVMSGTHCGELPRRPPRRVACTEPMPHDDLAYTIRRSPRARRIRVKVDPHDGIEVVIPQRATKREAQAAVARAPALDRPASLAEAERRGAALASPPGTVPVPRRPPRASAPRAGRTRAHRKGRRAPPAGRSNAGDAPRALVPHRGPAGRSSRGSTHATRRARPPAHDARHPQPAHPLGQLLVHRRDELQLAPHARPRAGARLRRLARGVPPRRHGPLAAVLGARRAPRPRLPRAAALAAPERRRARPPAPRHDAARSASSATSSTSSSASSTACPQRGRDRPRRATVHRGRGGGGAVAAVQLRKLAGAAAFFTALGNDDIADAVAAPTSSATASPSTPPAATAPTAAASPTSTHDRRAHDHDHRRAHRADAATTRCPGTTSAAYDAVYLTAGDAAAVRQARRAEGPRRDRPRVRRSAREPGSSSTRSSRAPPTPSEQHDLGRSSAPRPARSSSPRASAAARYTTRRRRDRPLGGHRRRPARPSTPTAAATRSPPASRSASAAG